jgi:hypothetical protein
VPEFAGLSLSRIGDLGLPLMSSDQTPGPPGEPAEEKVRARERAEHPQ